MGKNEELKISTSLQRTVYFSPPKKMAFRRLKRKKDGQADETTEASLFPSLPKISITPKIRFKITTNLFI